MLLGFVFFPNIAFGFTLTLPLCVTRSVSRPHFRYVLFFTIRHIDDDVLVVGVRKQIRPIPLVFLPFGDFLFVDALGNHIVHPREEGEKAEDDEDGHSVYGFSYPNAQFTTPTNSEGLTQWYHPRRSSIHLNQISFLTSGWMPSPISSITR